MVRYTSKLLPELEYFVKGENPKLLIHSGTHGDEYEIIDIVKDCVEKYKNNLPDFIFVPIVSPSAVMNKTRINGNRHDLNRIFFSDSTDIEVLENIKILNGHKFDLFVSFHEDPEFHDYYVYDEGLGLEESKRVLEHNKKIKGLGINLLNGVDDPNDSHLGTHFVEGYKKFVVAKDIKKTGMISSWAISEGITVETLVPEIPGKLKLIQKSLIIDTFFRDVLKIENNQ